MLATADSIEEIQDAVREAARIVPVAGASKPALSQSTDPDTLTLDVSGLSGLIEYDPAELTFTAQAATPILEIEAALAEHGQYLPFDPPRRHAGATLAGAVAAATSGPGAFRHGGVRDFVIGVGLIDGRGRLVSGGGKVVKNAAGFDLSKLMVGSMGRLGVMVRLSFKVFPRPRASTTLIFPFDVLEQALDTLVRLGHGPVMTDALELTPDRRLLVRLGGDPAVLDARARRTESLVGVRPVRVEGEDEAMLWERAGEFTWVEQPSQMVRVATTPSTAPLLIDTLGAIGVSVRLSLGANLAWVPWPADRPIEELDRRMSKLGFVGLRLDGPAGPVLLGPRHGGAFAERIAAALDPDHRFLEF